MHWNEKVLDILPLESNLHNYIISLIKKHNHTEAWYENVMEEADGNINDIRKKYHADIKSIIRHFNGHNINYDVSVQMALDIAIMDIKCMYNWIKWKQQ